MGNKHNKKAVRELTEHEINMLAKTSGATREELHEWYKRFLADHPKGTIDESQFVELYKKTFTYGNAAKFAQFAFAAFDDDHNGKVTIGEFILATAFLIPKDASREQRVRRLELAFDIFDVSLSRSSSILN
jgi:Ca2+-binding EF-hand superfamily protein